MAKYIYGGTLVAFTTARAGDVAAELTAVQTVSALEEKRVNDAIKMPVAESTDWRIAETPAQRINKVLAFDGAGDLAVRSTADASVIVDAGDLPILDAGGHYVATDVEGALAELLTGAQTITGVKTLQANLTFDSSSATRSLRFDTGAKVSSLHGSAIGDITLEDVTNARDLLVYDESADTFAVRNLVSTGAALTTPTLTDPVINGGVSGTANVGRFKRETSQATTSGTTKDFTGLPSWGKKITIIIDSVSFVAGGNIHIEIGDSDGLELTGYSSWGLTLFAIGGEQGFGSLVGFTTTDVLANASNVYGHITLTNITGNTWVSSGTLSSSSADVHISGGSKTLTGTLDRLRITSTTAATFDAGQITVISEG